MHTCIHPPITIHPFIHPSTHPSIIHPCRYTSVYVCTHMYKHTHIHAQIRLKSHTDIYIYICIYIHIYIYTYIHRYSYMHIHRHVSIHASHRPYGMTLGGALRGGSECFASRWELSSRIRRVAYHQYLGPGVEGLGFRRRTIRFRALYSERRGLYAFIRQ